MPQGGETNFDQINMKKKAKEEIANQMAKFPIKSPTQEHIFAIKFTHFNRTPPYRVYFDSCTMNPLNSPWLFCEQELSPSSLYCSIFIVTFIILQDSLQFFVFYSLGTNKINRSFSLKTALN